MDYQLNLVQLVSFFGQLLAGVDPTNLNPVKKLTKSQSYFFTHGDKDQTNVG